jgi:hypothetical protein
MKRNVAIGLAILCTFVFSVYCYSQAQPPVRKPATEGKEVTVSKEDVLKGALFATVDIKKTKRGKLVVNGIDGTYSSIKIFKSYEEFAKYLAEMPANAVPLVFDITLSPGVNYYAVAMGTCSNVAGRLICK